jgi:hypothetical protein
MTYAHLCLAIVGRPSGEKEPRKAKEPNSRPPFPPSNFFPGRRCIKHFRFLASSTSAHPPARGCHRPKRGPDSFPNRQLLTTTVLSTFMGTVPIFASAKMGLSPLNGKKPQAGKRRPCETHVRAVGWLLAWDHPAFRADENGPAPLAAAGVSCQHAPPRLYLSDAIPRTRKRIPSRDCPDFCVNENGTVPLTVRRLKKRAPRALAIIPCAASQKNDSFFKTLKGTEKRKKSKNKNHLIRENH